MVETSPTAATLALLAKRVQTCRDCRLCHRRKNAVIGVGRAGAPVMVVGQAPGWQEDREGVPFIGQAGQVLWAALRRAGFKVGDIYFTNAVKCYPGKQKGGDREPPPESLAACRPHLETEIKLVKPRIILAVGAVSMRQFGIAGGVRQNSGKLFQTEHGPVMPIIHPASLMRNPTDTAMFFTQVNGLQTFMRGVTVPPPHDGLIIGDGPFGVDIEVQDNKIWSMGISDGVDRTAGPFVAVHVPVVPYPVVFHSAVYDLQHLTAVGYKFPVWDDTILLAHMLGHKPLALKELSATFLGGEHKTFRETVDGRRFEDVPEMLDYNSKDAWMTRKLYDIFAPAVRAGGWWEHYEFEKRITPVIIQMEQQGLPVSMERLAVLDKALLRRMGLAEKVLRQHGIEDPGKRELVGQMFWRGKSRIETTKTGRLSTKGDDLRKNIGDTDRPWVNAFIDWHMAVKFRSTYTAAWKGKDTIHASINQTGAATWRFSCSNPNLQNISKKTFSDDEQVLLYHVFVAPPGQTFVSADASQGELRHLANLVWKTTGDTKMRDAYLSGRDLHKETAKIKYVKEAAKRLKLNLRDTSKRVNFGIAYLIGAPGLSRLINAPETVSQGIIDAFYEAYPGVRPFQEEMTYQAQKRGYVTVFDGQPLWIPGLAAEEGKLFYHGQAQAANFPIQGGLAKIVRMAMLRVPEYLRMQVHDELLWLVPTKQVLAFVAHLKDVLYKPYTDMPVPYTWKIKTGQSWGDIKELPEFTLETTNEESA